jgi:hypothetical protein
VGPPPIPQRQESSAQELPDEEAPQHDLRVVVELLDITMDVAVPYVGEMLNDSTLLLTAAPQALDDAELDALCLVAG